MLLLYNSFINNNENEKRDIMFYVAMFSHVCSSRLYFISSGHKIYRYIAYYISVCKDAYNKFY